jgi:hypothetical protein
VNLRPTRRGVLGGLAAGLLALLRGATARAAEVPPEAPPRCPHYYDGVLWCAGTPGRAGYYVPDAQGCPYCPGEDAALRPSASATGTTSFAYDSHGALIFSPSHVTTYVYDASPRRPPA